MTEEKDLRKDGMQDVEKSEEQGGVEEEKSGIKLKTIILLAICFTFFGIGIGFIAGRLSSEATIAAAQQEANTKVEVVQQEANAKVEKLEQRLQEEYIDKKYALLTEQYTIFTLLKENRVQYCIELIASENGKWLGLDKDALDDLVLADVGYLGNSDRKNIDDEKVLEYVDTLKKIVEKYRYSNDINGDVIWRMESLEESVREQIHNVATFEAMDELKKQCEANIALWN